MQKTKKRFRQIVILAMVFLLMFICPEWRITVLADDAQGLTVYSDLNVISKHGNVGLMADTAVRASDLEAVGIEYGDTVEVTFLDQTLVMPVVREYSEVETGVALIRIHDEWSEFAINMGDFASEYLADKTNLEDGSIEWTYKSGIEGPVEFHIALKTKGGLYEEYGPIQLVYTDARSDYPNLSDEEFANFRVINTTGMGRNILYRTSSPINPKHNRSTYADAALKKAGIVTTLNLADSKSEAEAYEGYNETYYSTTNHIELNMGVAYDSEDFRSKLEKGLRFLAENKGPYAIHCTEGQDRVGVMAAVLECFMGATFDEVKEDYMLSVYNYYGVKPGDAQYNVVVNENVYKTLQKLFDVEDPEKADLSGEAERYLREIGLNDTEIAQLRKNLSGSDPAGVLVYIIPAMGLLVICLLIYISRKRKMKMQTGSMLLVLCMVLTITLSGCGNKKEADVGTEPSVESVEVDKGAGGIPWIDSDIKENVTARTEVDPKDDFHLYANKEWILENSIPEGYMGWSHYAERELEVVNQCIELLGDESIEGHDAELVRTYNHLVLDWEARNELGISEYVDGYNKIADVKSLEDITKLYTDEETVYSYYNFLSFGADLGLNDPETYLVLVDSPQLLLMDSAEYSDRTEYGANLYGSQRDEFVYIGQKFGMTQEEAEECYDRAIALETKLASRIYTTSEMYSDDFYDRINNEMSFDEMAALDKVFPLADIIAASGYKYDGNYLVTSPEYFSYLDEIYTEENLEEIKALMIVNYMLPCMTKTDKAAYDKWNEIESSYFGKSGTVSDEEMAYNAVLEALPVSMQLVYIQKYGSEEERQKMADLCRQVIDSYRELLAENDWVSEEVKSYAIEKLDKIKINVAYPDKFRSTAGIDLKDCTLYEADNRIGLDDIRGDIRLIGTSADKEMWANYMSITDCNAFYYPSENSINMLLGMMGEPFYSEDMCVEELYASIGAFWVGHEISHAFDNNGSQFDAEGVYREWWTEEDKAEFNKRVEKMDAYLDTIVAFGDEHFIGTNSDTEMIADMTGLQCALRMASKIEGFDYRKFFVKYAQLNAAMRTYSREFEILTQDSHPLDYARTNVPVQQFEEFYEAFDVKEGDNMYLAPEDRLIIW